MPRVSVGWVDRGGVDGGGGGEGGAGLGGWGDDLDVRWGRGEISPSVYLSNHRIMVSRR